MSSPVSSFRTALIISMEKQRLECCLGESFIFASVAHMSIASCARERKFGFLLQVLETGLLCGSTLGVGGAGGAGGATLGGFVWGANLGVFSGKSILGSVCSKFSYGGSIGKGGDKGRQVRVKILLSLVFLVVNFGEWQCDGISIWGVAAAPENIVLRRFSSLWWDS